MSRRDYSDARYDDRESEIYRRPRRYRDDEDQDFVPPQRYPESQVRRPETVVKERDRETVVSKARSNRGPREPEFLREDYGKSSNAGPLVVREERKEEDTQSRRGAARRPSPEGTRVSRAPPPTEKVEKREEIVFRDRESRPPYPRSERGEGEEFIFRERTNSRPAPKQGHSSEEIDIKIKRTEDSQSRPPAPRSDAPPRSEVKERNVEEIRFRRGGADPLPSPSRFTEVEKEEIIFKEEHRSPPPTRGREVIEREEIDYRGRSMPPPRAISRGPLVAREREEWIVRRPQSRPPPPREVEKEEIIIRRKERSPSPSPPPPPAPAPPPPQRGMSSEEIIIRRRERSPSPDRTYEKEQIIIRRKERTPSPESDPEPPPPRMEPIMRPPIIQEYITHHRHIDHGFERVRSPSPTPPPVPPSPPREDNLEIEIRRRGVRNGKAYEEDITIEEDHKSRSELTSRQRAASLSTRKRSPSPVRHRYDDDVVEEADYYNRKASSRGYPGEAWNGATRDWGLVDVPPGTERVKMDGLGGASQEISWGRYDGNRRSKFVTGERAYERDQAPSLPPPPEPREERVEETRIERHITKESGRQGKPKDRMWTEVSKDLVIKEAVVESGYEFEETDKFFYVMEYLRYEDVLKLVELTEDIRRERRERIREIQWEREEIERQPKMLPPPLPPSIPPPPNAPYFDERIYERDYYYDREARRYR